MKTSGILDNSGLITNSVAPILWGARLILEGDDDFLEIYNSIGPEGGEVIMRLDKDVPYMIFDRPFRCKGMYALMSDDAKCIVYYDN